MLILQTLIFLLHSSMTFLTTFFLISISLSQSQNKDTTTKSLWHWIKILCHYISNEIQMYEIGSNHWIPSNYNPCYLSSIAHSHDLQRCTITTYISCCTYLSESRKGQTSGTGGVEGRSFASAMMCSKVMSVWVHTSTTWISWGGPWGRPLGVRRMTCTTTGSLAARKASTVSSWLDLDNSFPFTWGGQGKFKHVRKGLFVVLSNIKVCFIQCASFSLL